MQRGVSMVVAAGMLAATAPRARAQDNVYNPYAAPPDSAIINAQAYHLMPTFTNNIEGNVSSVKMVNQLQSNLATPFGAMLNFQLMKNERYYRLNDNSDLSKQLSLGALYPFRSGLTGLLANAGYSDSRVSNRYSLVGGSSQVYVFNDNGFNGGLSYNRAFPGMRVDAATSASAMTGERAYKTDETVGGGVNGGVAANIMGDRVVVQARGALRETSETSRTTRSVFDGLGASEDSISSVVRVILADSIKVRAAYTAYNGTRDYADQLQGSLGGQIPGEENVFQEHEQRRMRSASIGLRSLLFERLVLTLDTAHDEQLSAFDIQTTRYSNNVTDRVTGAARYTFPWKTDGSVSFDNTKSLRDLGAQSVSSYNENRQRVSAGLGRNFTTTLRFDASASTQLTQTFFVDTEANPRDRDQVDNLASLRISSQPYTSVSASITFSYASTQFINLDKSQSRNNRLKEHWELRPAYSWYLKPWLTISQGYGVVIEYTDYDFIPGDNFLDRNLIFTNTFMFKPYEGMVFRFDYQLYVHDKGSYLPTGPGGEDVLNVESKDRRNQLNLRLDYDLNARVAFFTDYRYNQFVDEDVVTGFQTPATDGQISIGTTGEYLWSKQRKFKFTLARVQRFGPDTSYKEKNYWDMLSELNFPL